MIRKTKKEKDLYQVMVILNKEDIEVRQYLASTLEEAQDIL
jgi:predicted MarR family transcription regulator